MPEGKRNETLETHIGIVGTEAKINQEELVKIRSKIWSIPIAVLAIVLMLAGALAVSGIVQAQAANIVKGGGDIVLGAVLDGQAITTITVDEADAAADPVEVGLDDDEAIVAVVLTGPDAPLFAVIGVTAGGVRDTIIAGEGLTDGEVSPRTAYDHDGDGTGENATPTISAAGVINSEETKAVYTFNVVVWFDTNTAVDSGKGYRIPVTSGQPPLDNPDTPGGDTATADDKRDDRDTSQTVTVTLYIPKIIKDAPAVDITGSADDTADGVDDNMDDVFFGTIPGSASQDDLLFGANGSSKAIRFAGLGPNSVVTVTQDTGVGSAFV